MVRDSLIIETLPNDVVVEWMEAVKPPWYVRVLYKLFRVKPPYQGCATLQEAIDQVPKVIDRNVVISLDGTYRTDDFNMMNCKPRDGQLVVFDGGPKRSVFDGGPKRS